MKRTLATFLGLASVLAVAGVRAADIPQIDGETRSKLTRSFVGKDGGTATNLTTVGLTNTGGFFLGGNGVIGTNGSLSTVTINGAGTTINSPLNAPNASSTAPSAIANVGTLDTRYGDTMTFTCYRNQEDIVTNGWYWFRAPYGMAYNGAGSMVIPTNYTHIRAMSVRLYNKGTAWNFATNFAPYLAFADKRGTSGNLSGHGDIGGGVPAWTNSGMAFATRVYDTTWGNPIVQMWLTNGPIAIPSAWFSTNPTDFTADPDYGLFFSRMILRNLSGQTITNAVDGMSGSITFGVGPGQ